MKRKNKSYKRPKKPFESERIAEENQLVSKYGLKNKKEVWKANARVNYYRGRAKALAQASPEEQEILFSKLQKIGLDVKTIADILDLKTENLLDRRLPTVVSTQGKADTPRQARQMVVHKRVLIDGNVVNSPSYIVSVSEEKLITVKESKPKAPKAEPVAEGEEAPAAETEAPKEEAESKAPTCRRKTRRIKTSGGI
jgi:small subunit ribosomal protein S4